MAIYRLRFLIGCVTGLFPPEAIQCIYISRFGVIPKNHQPNKWQLIIDLFYPTGHSVNDGISLPLCSLHYVSVDDAIRQIPYNANHLQWKTFTVATSC